MILILREEIICGVIIAFLMFYYSINKVKDKEKRFLKLVIFALIHVIFDIITVITVNSMDVVPDFINHLMHICFYLSGILFIHAFYDYVLNICRFYKRRKLLNRISYIPIILFVVLLIFLPMEYVKGAGTYYSYGPLAILGYGIFMIYCTASMVILLKSSSKLERKIKRSLIPMIVVMFAGVVAQAIIPELLLTSAGITFVCLGMFVALDNPDKDFKEQALWDFLTGLKNRNCYNRDLDLYIHGLHRRKSDDHIGFVVADLNYLKKINDTYGHAEGDKLITAAGEALKEHLRSAKNVYRLGGDEFVAIYLSPDEDKVDAEIRQVKTACEKVTGFAVPLQIAMGYASGPLDEQAGQIFDLADERMYEDKLNMKQKNAE